MLPTLVDLLDLRPQVEASLWPITDAVNIPYTDLQDRMHELPKPGSAMRVFDPYGLADLMCFLGERNWVAVDDLAFGDAGRCRLWEHNPLITMIVDKPGRVLDLGCGSGRDAVALACLGWEVVACDILARSLEMARDLEARYSDGSPITWLESDLRRGAPKGDFSLVTSFFCWKPEAIREAAARLSPHGIVAVEMFTPVDQARHGKPKHPASAADIQLLLPDFDVLHCSEAWRGDRHTVRYMGRSPSKSIQAS